MDAQELDVLRARWCKMIWRVPLFTIVTTLLFWSGWWFVAMLWTGTGSIPGVGNFPVSRWFDFVGTGCFAALFVLFWYYLRSSVTCVIEKWAVRIVNRFFIVLILFICILTIVSFVVIPNFEIFLSVLTIVLVVISGIPVFAVKENLEEEFVDGIKSLLFFAAAFGLGIGLGLGAISGFVLGLGAAVVFGIVYCFIASFSFTAFCLAKFSFMNRGKIFRITLDWLFARRVGS